MYENLLEEIKYAKTMICAREELYHAYGRITMALELGSISRGEFMELKHQCVAEDINNPKYF